MAGTPTWRMTDVRRIAILPSVLMYLPALAVPATAQEVSAQADDAATSVDDVQTDGSDILVVANRLKGQLDVPQAPVITLDETAIASYGASSLPDLIAALAPQTGSGRGRGSGMPVFLVNGQRISGFREMRNIPPEAIRRLEVLPEEVALRYGYPPNQRVINFILKDNFSSKSLDMEYGAPTRGGFNTSEFEAALLKINGPSRINLSAKLEDTSLLTEAERGVIQQAGSTPTVAGDPDPAANRSLIADSRDLTLNATWALGLGADGKGGQISFNAGFTRNDTLALSGLDVVRLVAPSGQSALRSLSDPLERRSRTDTVLGSVSFNKPLGDWQLTATIDASHAQADSFIDRRADTSALVAAAAAGTLAINAALPAVAAGGTDLASTKSDSATSLVTLVGRPLRLPGGEVTTTMKAGFAYTGIDSSDTRTLTGTTRLKRGDLSTGLNVAIPIASRREGFMAGLGELSLNVGAGVNRLSDFGSLTDWNAGVTWAPAEKLNLQASYMVNEAAPSLTQLGSPQVVTFNVPVYDFTRSETALVTVTSGGNRALLKEKQRDLKIAATWELPFLKNSNFMVEYFRNNSSDVTASFPLLTPAIEAAYPGRVVRDANGRLVSIDRVPVTFAKQTGERIRYGINLSGTIGKAPAGGAGGGMGPGMGRRFGGGAGGPGGPAAGGSGGPRGPMPGMMGGPGGGGQGRWNLSLYHTVRFSEKVTITSGGPVLDLLNGDALSGGGVARNALEMEGGGFYKGFGLRFNGSWTAPTHVAASGAPGSSDLRFGSLFNVNLRMFADIGQKKALTDAVPFLKGARLALTVDNLLDARQRVTDGSGAVPLSYQADYMDPRGRVLGIDFRKVF